MLTVTSQLSTVPGQLSIVTGQLSIVTDQLSTVTGQLSTVAGQLSAVTGQLSTVAGQLSTVTGHCKQRCTTLKLCLNACVTQVFKCKQKTAVTSFNNLSCKFISQVSRIKQIISVILE